MQLGKNKDGNVLDGNIYHENGKTTITMIVGEALMYRLKGFQERNPENLSPCKESYLHKRKKRWIFVRCILC